MFLGVLKEGHWLKDYLLMDAAGIQQMQLAVLAPLGKANMTDIQSALTGNKGQDVSVIDTS